MLDLERIAAVIRAQDAEVVALQEVDRHFGTRSEFRDQARELARLLGMHYVYAVNVRGVPFRVYNTHLQHNSALDRRLQVEAIVAEREEEGGPRALLGDLDARPQAPELAPLFPRLKYAWTLGGEGDGFAPFAWIDYVVVSPEVGVDAARVPHTLASDHLPVVAELTLPGAEVGVGRVHAGGKREGGS